MAIIVFKYIVFEFFDCHFFYSVYVGIFQMYIVIKYQRCSTEKLYYELGLESLQNRRWLRKCFVFYKIVKKQSPKYLFGLTLICINWVPGDPRTIFLVTSFTRKMPESSDSMYSSIFMLENIWYHHFTWSAQNSQEIVDYVPIQFGSRGTHNWNKSQFLVNSVRVR